MPIETSRTIVKIPFLDTRARTIVVAASNSIDPTLAPAIYRCDGTNDQVEINNAITALGATGGTVMLLEGQYNITASINLATLTTLMGQGAGTVLRIPNGHNANLNVISAVSVNRVLVADLRVDGNRANQAAGAMTGIYFNIVTYSEIARCWVENMYGEDGIALTSSNNNTIAGNICQFNEWDGIWLIHLDNNNTITGNNCYDNGWGISLTSSNNNTITGNNCQGNIYQGIYIETSSNNTITGNNCQSNGADGIYLITSSNNNTITGNICQSNVNGIYLATSSNNTITGNICQSNGQYGISLTTSSNNTVTGNTVYGNSQALNNTYDGIFINSNSDYNNIQGNTVRHAGGANQHRYGIRINIANCDGNLVINNDLYLAGFTADYSDAGTGTIYHNNRLTVGWVP